MIFSQPLYGKVLRGEKTETRRLVKPSDWKRDIHGDVIPVDKYHPGKRIAVQKGRGVHGEGHIILTAVRREPLGLLDFAAARAEGFRDTISFKTYWLGLHDTTWVKRQAKSDDPDGIYALEDDEIIARFDERWAPKEVWVLTFQLDRAEPPIMLMQGSPLTDGGKARLMSNRKIPPGRATSSKLDESSLEAHGYTPAGPRAMPGEPEPVDATTQKMFAREGHAGWAGRELQRELDRENLAAEERLRLVRIDARAAGVDIAHLEASILGRLRAAERKVRNSMRAVA